MSTYGVDSHFGVLKEETDFFLVHFPISFGHLTHESLLLEYRYINRRETKAGGMLGRQQQMPAWDEIHDGFSICMWEEPFA